MVVALSSALIIPRSLNRYPHKLAPKVPKTILRNLPLCFFGSFLIILPGPFINKPDYSSDLTIFITSFVSSFKIINVVTSDPNIFL